MSRDSEQEKTEPATEKRLQEMREKGQVVKSREVSSIAVLIAGLLIFYFSGFTMVAELMKLMQWAFSNTGVIEIKSSNIEWLLLTGMGRCMKILAPFLIAVVAAGLISNCLQVGFIFSIQQVVPRLSKLDPLNGFKKLVSKEALVELGKNIFKVVVVGYVTYLTVRGELNHLILSINMEVSSVVNYIGKVCFIIVLRTSWVLIVLALLDYAFQKWNFQQESRMTKQEVRDEFKQREGDPLVKARIRQVQRELAKRRMMEAVPKADVVITNPVHVAVAMEYSAQTMSAPRVTAKGARLLAERIKEIARSHQVPIVENKPLAQALYKGVKIGQEIPAAFYKAVAEILAYVYRLKHKGI